MRFPRQVPPLSFIIFIILAAFVYVLFGCSIPAEPIIESSLAIMPEESFKIDTVIYNTYRPKMQIKYSFKNYSIIIDVSEHESDQLVDGLARQFFSIYPRMATQYNPRPYSEVYLYLTKNTRTAGAAGSNVVILSSSYLNDHPDDFDMFTHELFHVVQDYPQWKPEIKWITEGLADYGRHKFGIYDPINQVWNLNQFSLSQHYTNGYKTTARFFVWLEIHLQLSIERLNLMMRIEKYTSQFWIDETGKSIDDLWELYTENPSLRSFSSNNQPE